MLAQHVAEILTDRTVVAPCSGRAVTLKERNVMKVTVAGLPDAAVVIDLDRMGSLSGVKDGPWKQACDYLIVFHDGTQDGALFVELKKTLSDRPTDGGEQLRRSLPILRYLESMCAIHFDAMANMRPALVRYALIGKRGSQRLDKQRVRARGAPRVEPYKGIQVVSVIGERVAFASLTAH